MLAIEKDHKKLKKRVAMKVKAEGHVTQKKTQADDSTADMYKDIESFMNSDF